MGKFLALNRATLMKTRPCCFLTLIIKYFQCALPWTGVELYHFRKKAIPVGLFPARLFTLGFSRPGLFPAGFYPARYFSCWFFPARSFFTTVLSTPVFPLIFLTKKSTNGNFQKAKNGKAVFFSLVWFGVF